MPINKLQSMLNKVAPTFMKLFSEKEGIKQYQKILKFFLNDGIVDPLELEQLTYLEDKYNLTKDEIKKIQRATLSTYFKEIISDQRISEEERKSLEDLMNLFSLQTEDINFDQRIFNKYYTLGLIEQGLLPKIENTQRLNIIFNKNEILHYGAESQLNKIKKITKRINYGGLTGSIKIMKGVRFRVGSLAVQTKTQEVLETEDSGILYITNQRIGFKGNKKQFNILFNKIISFELYAEGIFIFKQGKETPYILSLIDYEVPLSILSFILNK